jgi:hypothetical protein
MYIQKLKANHMDVVEMLADYLVQLRRSKEGLGLCMRQDCVLQFRGSQAHKNG